MLEFFYRDQHVTNTCKSNSVVLIYDIYMTVADSVQMGTPPACCRAGDEKKIYMVRKQNVGLFLDKICLNKKQTIEKRNYPQHILRQKGEYRSADNHSIAD